MKIQDKQFVSKLNQLTNDFENSTPNNVSLLTHDQVEIVEKIRFYSRAALTPLQRLEHAMQPVVAFVIMPIFAIANAGITFSGSFTDNMFSNVSLGVILGLVLGKFIGIVSIAKLLIKLKLAELPLGLNWRHIYGVALLAGVGFTMSLFVTDLAFDDPTHIIQAKIGIFVASVISGVSGFFFIIEKNLIKILRIVRNSFFNFSRINFRKNKLKPILKLESSKSYFIVLDRYSNKQIQSFKMLS